MNRRQSVGVFTTDTALVVQSWDPWMAAATGLAESTAVGQRIVDLYPDLASRGMLGRLARIASGAGVEVLAPAFHKYLIPCPPREPNSRLERMRQHVTIAPLRDRDGIVGVVVTIEDVTAPYERDRRLAADLDSEDEATRLRAAETLAAAGESPVLLAGSLSDQSWRVRRVAAEGLASGGGPEVLATLVDALRDHHRDASLLNAALTALARTREDAVMMVIELLGHPTPDVRTYAALALGLMADSRAVAPLMKLLGDEDTNVRFHAIEALGRIRDGEAADALATIAEQRDFFLSFAALDALAEIGEPTVVPRLTPLLDDPSLLAPVVLCLGALGAEETAMPLARLIEQPDAPVAQIATALVTIQERMQSQIGAGALVADLARSAMREGAMRAIEGALELASVDDIRPLLIVLSWLPYDAGNRTLATFLARADTRLTAAECLARRGVKAAPSIVEVATAESGEVRRAAAEVLGRLGSNEPVPTLIEWLTDQPDVIIAAAGALGAIGDRRAFTPLLAVLDHEEAAVRQAAVSALNSIGHPKMEEAVSARLTDPSPRVRESAARIAGYFGYSSCLRRVVELCDDDDEVVRRAAVEHLAGYDQRPAWSKVFETVGTDTSATVRAAAARAMGQTNSAEALAALVKATSDRNLWVRYFALRSLGRQGVAHADALICLAECATRDDAPPVRIAAIDSLAALGSPSMARVLFALVHDSDVDVACAAIAAMAKFDPEGSESALRFALDSHDRRLVRAAFATLASQRAQYAVSTIASIIRESRDDELRADGVATLGRIGGHDGVTALLELSSDRTLREAATSALGVLSPEDTAQLREGLEHTDERRRRVVIDALSRTKNSSAAVLLAAALDDSASSVRLAAARALGRIDLRDARAQLAALARTDENLAVRLAAQDALSR
ncbi:MAG TPA: HEAT repeat domain-containing protein [Gemmatimonadaceae bacterium]